MGIRTRSLRLAISLAVFFATFALPEIWTSQIPGRPVGARVAWASGTPDETLKPSPPPKAPPKSVREAASYAIMESSEGAIVKSGRTGRVAGVWTVRVAVFWATARVTLLRR
jgi:hypothetical protein